MKQRPLISICIPTYNQPDSVRNFLQLLEPQLSDAVEIVIQDDSPDNATERIVQAFAQRIPIRYFHRKKEGIDKAILSLTKEARGTYVWWFGDDVVAPDGLKQVLQILTEHPDITFLYANSQEINKQELVFPHRESEFFSNRNEVIEYLTSFLGFITATIFKREKALEALAEAKQFVGTAWVNLFIILSVLSQDGSYYFLRGPIFFSARRDFSKPTWYDALEVFSVHLFHVFIHFSKQFSPASIHRVLNYTFAGCAKGIFVQRAKGFHHGLGSDVVSLWTLAQLYWRFSAFWRSLPLLVSPRWLDAFLYKTYKEFTNYARRR